MGSWFNKFSRQYANAIQYLQSGGIVMVPLLILSFLMWVLIFRKLSELYSHARSQNLAQRSANAEKASDQTWQSDILADFNEQRTFNAELDKKLVQKIIQQHSSGLEEHVQTIFVLASTAPLLGLIGTVTGMITTFEAISRFGAGNARALASGISEALITTQSGLIVAIPGLFMGNFIKRRVLQCQNRMERFGLRLVRGLSST